MDSYELSERAKIDLVRIYHYGRRVFGERQAELYFQQLKEQFQFIANNPYTFAAVDEIKSGYRRCVFKSNSIFYIIKSESVEIRAIIGNQDISSIL